MIAQASYGDETSVLVAEMNHRFFNSFQVITALVARCGRAKTASDLRPILDDINGRVSAFAAVHRQLACPNMLESFEVRCRRLCVDLVQAFGRSDRVEISCADIALSAVQGERLPIIIVEMVTNVLKHGSRTQDGGLIKVVMAATCAAIEVSVSDNGATPCPADNPKPSRTVEALATSLAGTAFVADHGGYVVCVRVPRPQTRSFRPRLALASDRSFADVAA